MLKSDTIELAEIELDRLVMVFYKSGLNFNEITKLLKNKCKDIKMQAETELYLKGDK